MAQMRESNKNRTMTNQTDGMEVDRPGIAGDAPQNIVKDQSSVGTVGAVPGRESVPAR
jgi:hypothetical protein